MKLNPNEQFEVEAEAFRIMTGQLAPGKDAAAIAGPSYEERCAAWNEWLNIHGKIVRAVITAFEHVMYAAD